MGLLSESPEPEHNDGFEYIFSCMECEWEGELSECDFDYEHDEFSGRDIKYPICPVCGGGLDY